MKNNGSALHGGVMVRLGCGLLALVMLLGLLFAGGAFAYADNTAQELPMLSAVDTANGFCVQVKGASVPADTATLVLKPVSDDVLNYARNGRTLSEDEFFLMYQLCFEDNLTHEEVEVKQDAYRVYVYFTEKGECFGSIDVAAVGGTLGELETKAANKLAEEAAEAEKAAAEEAVAAPAETTAPVAETTAPVAETTAPAEETTAPVAETTAPVAETTAPVAETTAPVAETTAPVAETTAPVAETTVPVEETTAPAEETTAPVEETTAPAEETTAPAEETPVADRNLKTSEVNVGAVFNRGDFAAFDTDGLGILKFTGTSYNVNDLPAEETAEPATLYDRLMACATMDEVNAILDNLTEEENAEMEAFTEEQNAALSEKMDALGAYEVVLLDKTSVEQGESLTYTSLENVLTGDNNQYKLLKDGSEVNASSFGITVTFSYYGGTLEVQTSETTPVGEYEIRYGNKGIITGNFYQAGTLKLTVTAKPTSAPVTETKQMTYNKTVTLNEAGNYNLELTISGAVGTQDNKAKVDLVIVIDNSGSMYNGRMQSAKQAANSLITSLSSNNRIDARYCIVVFSGSSSHDYSSNRTYGTAASGWNDSSSASMYVTGIQSSTTDGTGTNYEAGLRLTQEQLNNARPGSTKIVVFLTDGSPTLRASDRDTASSGPNGNTYSDGKNGFGNGQNDNEGKNIAAAKSQANDISMNRFYVVGFGDVTDVSYLQDFANSASKATVRKGIAANKSTDLITIFDDIAGDISTFLCSNVTVTDTLSHKDENLMVQLTNADTVKVKVLDSDGEVIYGPASMVTLPETQKNPNGGTLTATYDTATGTLKLDFPDDYVLEPDYTYVLCAEIEPTETAYQAYRADGYTNVGDANTGYHSGQVGFYSNDTATATYTYQGSNGSVTYDKPVVQLKPGQLVITKTIEGLSNEQITALKDILKFKITLTYPEPTSVQNPVEIPLSAFTESNGTYTYTIDKLSPNTQYIVEEIGKGIDGMKCTTVVTVDNVKNDAENDIVRGTVGKGNTVTVAYKNSYEVATATVTIYKYVDGNMASQNDTFAFTVEGDSVADADKSFSLKHGDHKDITVKIGDTITVSENRGNYTVTNITVNNGTPQSNVAATNGTVSTTYTVTDAASQTIAFQNVHSVTLDTGVSLDSLPYILILGVVVVGAVVIVVSRSKHRRDY